MKRFFVFFLVLVFFCMCVVAPFSAVAENDNDFKNYCQSEGIDYMTSDQYEVLVNSLIDGNDYGTAYHDATGSYKKNRTVNLDKDDKTINTNFSLSNIFSTIKDVLNLGKEVYDATSDAVKNQEYGTDWDTDIPVASQLIGKTKLYYDNGVIELITLGVSFVRYYDSTPAIDMYRNKMQIYGIRQIVSMAGYAATDFTVDIDEGFLPVQYDSSTMLCYSAKSGVPVVYDGSDGEVFGQASGFYSALGFSRVSLTNPNYYLYFMSLDKQAVTYKKLTSYAKDSDLYLYNTHTSDRQFIRFPTSGNSSSASKYNSTSSIVYTISDMQTNSKWDYVSATHHDQTVYEPSVTYNNVYNAGDKITNNNYKSYGYDYDIDNNTWTYDTDYYNSWQGIYNDTVINNYYNNYQTIDNSGSVFGDVNNTTIKPFDDPEEPETQPPTDPSTQPPTETYPPVTDPTESSPIDLPATIPTESAVPKYTLDMTAVSSDIEELKKQSTSVSIGKSFWVIRVLDYMLNELGLMPLFLLLFFFGVLGVLLWK